LKMALISPKSRIQPVCGSTSPSIYNATRKEWPWRRPHLCPSGTCGKRCADSNVNSLKISTGLAHPKQAPTAKARILSSFLRDGAENADCPSLGSFDTACHVLQSTPLFVRSASYKGMV